MRKRTVPIATAIVLLAVGLALAIVLSGVKLQDGTQPGAFGGPNPASGAALRAPSAPPASCAAHPAPIADPVTLTLVRQGKTLPMLSLGKDATGAAGAPPGNASHTVAWFNEGPKVGSDKGKVLLTSHTYRFGGALGNELNNGLLSPGDIVMITGSDGSNACYRYASSLHIIEAQYDPYSTVVYDYAGAPQFALVVCSDYDKSGNPLGRMVYYGDLITSTGA